MKTVFISSTFRDMQAERDALAQIVLPDVAAEAAKHQEDIDFIDLRWGVDTTELESEEGARKVLSICLDEIEHARPYMIILLGDRYGWVPEQELIRQASSEKGYSAEGDFKSVTALEIEFGALADGRQLDRCLFYRREGLDISRISEADAAVYGAESEKHREKLLQLISKIEARIGYEIPTYSVEWDEKNHSVKGLDDFCDRVSADLKALFEDEWKKSGAKSEQEQSISESRLFFEKKSAECVAVDGLLEEYENCIDEKETSFFFLTGPSGCGKSTIMGRMAADFANKGGDVFPFACGHSAQTGTSVDLLEQLDVYLSGILEIEPEESDESRTFKELRIRLMKLIGLYAAQRKDKTLYIFVDAMELLAGEGVPRLGWAPDILSDNIKIICSFTNDKKFDPPLRAKDRVIRRECGSLKSTEIELIVQAAFARAHKQISPNLLEKIVSLKPAENPLYLALLAHRLMMLNSSDFGEIARLGNDMQAINSYLLKKIEEAPDTIDGLCRTVLAEAGTCIDKDLADSVTKLIAKPAHGLREKDILAILEKRGRHYDALSFARLIKYLRPFFLYGADGRIEYAHRILRDAVYLGMEKDIRKATNVELFEYLKTLPASDPVCADYRTEFAWLAGDRQDIVRFVGGLDADKDKRANRAAMIYLVNTTRSTNELVHKQIAGFFDNIGSYMGCNTFVRKLAKEIYSWYPLSDQAQHSLQWVYRSLLQYMEQEYDAGRLPLDEFFSANVKLIRSYTETAQFEKTTELLNKSMQIFNSSSLGGTPEYFGSMSLLHRFFAEYYRDTFANKAEIKQMMVHCSEAERLAQADPSGSLFGLINAKLLYCAAYEIAAQFSNARRKAEETVPLCEKFYEEKKNTFRKKVLANALSFVGQDSLFDAWFGKMELQTIEQSRNAYQKAMLLYEEVMSEERSFDTYLKVSGTYAGAAEAEIFYWSVCPEAEMASCLQRAKALFDKSEYLITATAESIQTIRVKQTKLAYLYKLYAWYGVQKDKAGSDRVYKQIMEISQELNAKTNDKRINSFNLALGLRVPKRKKAGLFGRK